jgi:hypothetical protein
LDRNWSCHKDAEESLAVTSHSRIAEARLFSEVVTDEEGRAMTLDSVPSEARPPDSHHP